MAHKARSIFLVKKEVKSFHQIDVPREPAVDSGPKLTKFFGFFLFKKRRLFSLPGPFIFTFIILIERGGSQRSSHTRKVLYWGPLIIHNHAQQEKSQRHQNVT